MSADKEDPMLRDEYQSSSRDKKRFKTISIIAVVMGLVLIAGVALCIVFQIKASDKQKTRDELDQQKRDLEADEERRKLDRNLDLSSTNLLDISIELKEPASGNLEAGAIIEQLNLKNNKLRAFHFNKIFSLKKLYLVDNNTIVQFAENRLDSLQTFDIHPLKDLVVFANNTMPTVQVLDVSELEKLTNFTGNILDNLKQLSLPIGLLHFDSNHLSKLEILDLSQLDKLLSLNDNFLPVPSLTIDNPQLVGFTNSQLPQLKELKILRNNFRDATLLYFQNLETLMIDDTTSLGNTTGLTLRNASKLTKMTLKMKNLNNAWVQNTLLTSFPDADSDLPKLLSVFLKDNPLMTKLYTSKMPNVQDYEIINTPIDSTDSASTLKELEFTETSLKYFKNWRLDELQSLILKRNTQMTVFSNNTLNKLKSLVIEKQNFTESSNNSFPNLQRLSLTSVPFNSVNIGSDIAKMKSLTLVDNSLPTNYTFDSTAYPILEDLTIDKNSIGNLTLHNDQHLIAVVVNSSDLSTLDVQNSRLTNFNYINNISNLRNLRVVDTPLNQLATDKLINLENLFLKNISLTDLPTTNMTDLQTAVLIDLPLTNLSFINKGDLNTITLDLKNLNQLSIISTNISSFEGHYLPEITDLSIISSKIPSLVLSLHPKLRTISLNIATLTALQLFDNQITTLNGNSIPAIQTLMVSNIPLQYFNQNFTNLKTLGLNDIEVDTFTLDLEDTQKLEYLELTNNFAPVIQVKNLALLSTVILKMPKLTNFTIANLSILTSANFTIQAANLQQLIIDNMPNFTEFVGRNSVTGLKKLWIRDTKLAKFENNNLPNLQWLQLENLDLTTLTLTNQAALKTFILNLSTLTNLTLISTGIPNLDNCTLINLKDLTISNTPVSSIPTFATVQNVWFNNVAFADSLEFSKLPNMKTLKIENTNIPRLNFMLTQNNLQTIELNNLTTSSGITGTNFTSLTSLRITNSPNFDILANNKFPVLTTLYLDKTGITNIADNTYEPGALDTVYIDHSADAFPDFRVNSSSLRIVTLDSAGVNTYGTTSTMPNVEEIYILGTNTLSTLNLAGNTKIRTIVIQNSKLVTFSNYNVPLQSLTLWDSDSLASIQNNIMTSLANMTLRYLSKITKFTLVGNNIPNMTRLVITDSPSITTVSGENLNATYIQMTNNTALHNFTLNQLPKVTSLNLNQNVLTDFHNNTLTVATNVDLSNNRLTVLANNSMPVIQTLNLQNNQLANLADLAANVNNSNTLRTLNLDNNKLLSLPEFHFGNLDTLTVSGNGLISFNITASTLSTLVLDRNNLTVLDITNHPNIKNLWAARNNLETMNFGGVSQLEALILSNNNFSSLGNGVFPKLTQLLVENNKLTSLGTPNWPALEHLNLYNNLLDGNTVIAALINTTVNPQIKSIDLRENPLGDAAAVLSTLKIQFPEATILVD